MTSYAHVAASTRFPFSAVVSIHVTYSDGSRARGSGAVVGRNDVVTSAHVVGEEDGLRVRSIEVRPAHDDGRLPFGAFKATHWTWYPVDEDGDGLLGIRDIERDYAILTVENPEPIGDVTGWFGLSANAATPSRHIYLESAGYPGGPQPLSGDLSMIRTWGYEYFDGRVIEHDFWDETGQDWAGGSGSAFWQDRADGPHVVAVLSTSASATYIDAGVFGDLVDWMADNDPQRLIGGRGADRLAGGFKDDVIVGKRGADILRGGGGDDLIRGGGGADRLKGGAGRDELRGDNGRDRLDGGGGRDSLVGGPGADFLDGGPGRDVARGGDDTFWFARGDGRGNLVKDFDPERDGIAIGVGASRLAHLDFERRGDDALLAFANVTVRFEDVSPGDLRGSEIDFV